MRTEAPQGAGPSLVKRYANRKLYDAAAGRYVTLEELARRVGAGEDVQVVDQKTGDDLTAAVLAQALFEGIRQRNARIPARVLARLLRMGTSSAGRWAESVPQQAAGRAREEAERIVSGLVSRGRLSLDEALALRQEIAGSVQRIVGEAQRRIEQRLHGVLERGEGDGVGPSLRALRDRLMTFESYLEDAPAAGRRRGRTQPGPPARRGSGRSPRTRRRT
jgi:polyhydroxyalkanoate synthesis repressor PhaR